MRPSPLAPLLFGAALVSCGADPAGPDPRADAGTSPAPDAGAGPTPDAGPTPAPDFALADTNPTSPLRGQAVSPRDFLERVSGWYFTHAS